MWRHIEQEHANQEFCKGKKETKELKRLMGQMKREVEPEKDTRDKEAILEDTEKDLYEAEK